jgi:hypothetical protein
VESVTGDGTEATNAETGTREGLTVNHCGGEAERSANYTDFVLEEELQRFNEFEFFSEVCGKTAYVVMGFNRFFAFALLNTFKNVGVDGTLCEEGNAVELTSFVREYVDEFLTDDLALAFRIGNACEKVEETVGCVDIDQVSVELVAEKFNNCFAFVFAHEAVVNVYANELLADRLQKKSGNDGRVNTAGKREQNLLVADLSANLCDLFCDESFCEFRGGNTSHGIRSEIGIHFSIPPKNLKSDIFCGFHF